jgi:hypothetical protein
MNDIYTTGLIVLLVVIGIIAIPWFMNKGYLSKSNFDHICKGID